MKRASSWVLALLLAPPVLLGGGCGSSSYLISRGDYEAARGRQGGRWPALPAQAEPTGAPVYVSGRKLQLERAEPLGTERVRVRPRRPLGLVIGGAITLGIGAVLMGAGGGVAYCPPDPRVFCEQGIAVAAIMGIAAPHLLVGGILEIVAAARWSPEVR
jgi:hypothetical protein